MLLVWICLETSTHINPRIHNPPFSTEVTPKATEQSSTMSKHILTSIVTSPLHTSSLRVVLCPFFLPSPHRERKKRYKLYVRSMHVDAAHKGIPTHKQKRSVAFFDVDGTITKTNVVAAYFRCRVREIPMAIRFFWLPWFAISCLVFFIVDRVDRTAFNRLFYWASFKNRSIQDKITMARTIYQDYYQPRMFTGAVELIQLLKKQGYHIVLVTGSLDFLIEALARELGADFVYASQLVEKEGRFTGQVKGTGASSTSKAQCVQSYAKAHQLCLSSSLAFGDSIADLCMLETVGMPHAVNPDRRLKSIAASRGWPIIYWKLEKGKTTFSMSCISSLFSSRSQISETRENT